MIGYLKHILKGSSTRFNALLLVVCGIAYLFIFREHWGLEMIIVGVGLKAHQNYETKRTERIKKNIED